MGGSGGPTIAEATVKGGKKKEAVVQCALEACKILNQFGLLRQSNHESRAKRQVKKWKEDDYYDSDEDEFLDRTGTIAAKRQKRMQIEATSESSSEVQKPIVDTYDSLLEKRKNLQTSIDDTEKQIREAIEALNHSKQLQQSDNEDLDAYMATLSKTEKGHGGKENVSRLRQLLQTQQTEVKTWSTS